MRPTSATLHPTPPPTVSHVRTPLDHRPPGHRPRAHVLRRAGCHPCPGHQRHRQSLRRVLRPARDRGYLGLRRPLPAGGGRARPGPGGHGTGLGLDGRGHLPGQEGARPLPHGPRPHRHLHRRLPAAPRLRLQGGGAHHEGSQGGAGHLRPAPLPEKVRQAGGPAADRGAAHRQPPGHGRGHGDHCLPRPARPFRRGLAGRRGGLRPGRPPLLRPSL